VVQRTNRPSVRLPRCAAAAGTSHRGHCATIWQAGLGVVGWNTGLVHDLELCCRVGRRCAPHLPSRCRMMTRADRRTVVVTVLCVLRELLEA
jgi:hypothetical protein